MTQPWNQAALKARNYRTYRPVKPIAGLQEGKSCVSPLGEPCSCVTCGYHVCSCRKPPGNGYCYSCGHFNCNCGLTRELRTGNWGAPALRGREIEFWSEAGADGPLAKELDSIKEFMKGKPYGRKYAFPELETNVQAEPGRLYWYTIDGVYCTPV